MASWNLGPVAMMSGKLSCEMILLSSSWGDYHLVLCMAVNLCWECLHYFFHYGIGDYKMKAFRSYTHML